jgi:hypothetical protein
MSPILVSYNAPILHEGDAPVSSGKIEWEAEWPESVHIYSNLVVGYEFGALSTRHPQCLAKVRVDKGSFVVLFNGRKAARQSAFSVAIFASPRVFVAQTGM